jgi:hypothetical protein
VVEPAAEATPPKAKGQAKAKAKKRAKKAAGAKRKSSDETPGRSRQRRR